MNWKSLHVCLLLNPSAGGSRRRGKCQGQWIETLARHIGKLEILVPQDQQDTERLLESGWNCDVILAGGGDGTLHHLVRCMAESSQSSLPLIGQLPFGSGNDFLRQFDFHRLTERNLERFLQCEPVAIDLGQCNGRWFINGIGFGLAADVGKAFQESGYSGPLGYVSASIGCAFKHKPVTCRIRTESETLQMSTSLMAIGNGPYSGGGFRLTPSSLPGDGRMELCVVEGISALRLISCLPSARKGRHISEPFVRMLEFRSLSLEFQQAVIGQLDGEILPASKEWKVQVHPKKVQFLKVT